MGSDISIQHRALPKKHESHSMMIIYPVRPLIFAFAVQLMRPQPWIKWVVFKNPFLSDHFPLDFFWQLLEMAPE